MNRAEMLETIPPSMRIGMELTEARDALRIPAASAEELEVRKSIFGRILGSYVASYERVHSVESGTRVAQLQLKALMFGVEGAVEIDTNHLQTYLQVRHLSGDSLPNAVVSTVLEFADFPSSIDGAQLEAV